MTGAAAGYQHGSSGNKEEVNQGFRSESSVFWQQNQSQTFLPFLLLIMLYIAVFLAVVLFNFVLDVAVDFVNSGFQ